MRLHELGTNILKSYRAMNNPTNGTVIEQIAQNTSYKTDKKRVSAIELYAMLDRYQEDGLSVQCLGVFQKGLSDANVINLLAEIDGLGLDGLKDVCMENVVTNYGKSLKEVTTDSLSSSLMAELLCNLGERLC